MEHAYILILSVTYRAYHLILSMGLSQLAHLTRYNLSQSNM